MVFRLVGFGLAVCGALMLPPQLALAEDDEEPACGTLPPEVVANNLYAGFGNCALKQAREQSLWKGLRSPKLLQQSRFTLTDGHLRWLWTIRIDERADGKGRVEVTRIGRRGNNWSRMEVKRHWHRNISREDMARFNELTQQAGIWQFENGTWDDDDVLFTHCIMLGMEKVTRVGFRYSHVNIGCNRPQKLQAPLEHVLDMAELDWDDISPY